VCIKFGSKSASGYRNFSKQHRVSFFYWTPCSATSRILQLLRHCASQTEPAYSLRCSPSPRSRTSACSLTAKRNYSLSFNSFHLCNSCSYSLTDPEGQSAELTSLTDPFWKVYPQSGHLSTTTYRAGSLQGKSAGQRPTS